MLETAQVCNAEDSGRTCTRPWGILGLKRTGVASPWGDMRWCESLIYERMSRNKCSKWTWPRREISLFPIWKRPQKCGLGQMKPCNWGKHQASGIRSTVTSPACPVTHTGSCGQQAEILGQKHLSIRPISAKRRASGDEGMLQDNFKLASSQAWAQPPFLGWDTKHHLICPFFGAMAATGYITPVTAILRQVRWLVWETPVSKRPAAYCVGYQRWGLCVPLGPFQLRISGRIQLSLHTSKQGDPRQWSAQCCKTK